MAVICKNCGGTLVFDPELQKMICDRCGSEIDPGEVEFYAKDILENKKTVPLSEIRGLELEDDYMDCSVYTCDYCGGEVIVNGTEASTVCIFCGNPSIVFSRIARQRRPGLIVPFKITRKEALKSIRSHFKSGIFIPHEVKHFKEKHVRGIYIPYWIVNAEHSGSVIIQASVDEKDSRHTNTYYYGRSGTIMIRDLPVDASKLLSYEISSKLEPYGIKTAKEFNEDYLAGFYSSIADERPDDLSDLISKRAANIFEEGAKEDLMDAVPVKILESRHSTDIDYSSIRYAMLPAWFITYEHKGQHNTILVNGETGKVVCGVPWNKALFYTLYALFAAVMSTGAAYIINMVLGDTQLEYDDKLVAAIMTIAIAGVSFVWGFKLIKKVYKSLRLTQGRSVFNFVKRRQG